MSVTTRAIVTLAPSARLWKQGTRKEKLMRAKPDLCGQGRGRRVVARLHHLRAGLGMAACLLTAPAFVAAASPIAAATAVTGAVRATAVAGVAGITIDPGGIKPGSGD
jgi:hypothetical protein